MFSIPLNNNSDIPLYEQIYQYIKQEITNRHIIAGEKLPSARNMATYLNVSRSTIDMAYGQLLSEGYIDSKPKKGYYVNDVTGLKITTSFDTDFEERTPLQNCDLSAYDFSPYTVDTSCFPFHTWKQLSNQCLMNADYFFKPGESQGDYMFRKAIQGYLHQARGVLCSTEQIIIGAGGDYLLHLLCSILESGQIVAMEDPAYKQAMRIFSSQNFSTTQIPVDRYGMDIDELKKSNASIAYVTPSHQYPLGIIMPIKRRLSLLSWAGAKKDRYIIEDDHDSEFRYVGKPIPSLQSIDSLQKVIYMGTFSKAISPAIRMAYMVLPLPLLKRYKEHLSCFSSTVSRMDQQIMTRFIMDGYFERHLNRMRKKYKLKHDILLNALRIFNNFITIHGGNAGLHLVVTFHIDRTEESIIAIAKENGIHLYPLSEHYIKLPDAYEPTFLFGYANMEEQDILDGIRTLYEVLF